MVKDHSDSERGNPLPPHGLLFPISSNGSFICTIPRPLLYQSWSTGWNDKWLNGSTMKDRSDDPSHHERTLLPRSYISLPRPQNVSTVNVYFIRSITSMQSLKTIKTDKLFYYIACSQGRSKRVDNVQGVPPK